MTVTAFWYAKAFVNAFTQAMPLDWDTNAIKLMLTTSSYTPNQDTHEDKADVDNEVSGTGYTAGGATLANKSLSNTNNVVAFDADDVTWASSSITARRAVLYDSVGGGADASRPLILWIDFGEDKTSDNGNFTVQFHADGIAKITAVDATGYPA